MRAWSGDSDWSAVGGFNRRSAFGSLPTLLRYDMFSFEHDSACGTDPQVSSVRPRAAGDTICSFNAFHYQDQFTELKRLGASLSGNFQISADLSVFGRLFGTFPGGPVGIAIGLQYREQEPDQWADEGLQSGDLIYDHQPVNASRDIFAAYVEFDLPLAQSLKACRA